MKPTRNIVKPNNGLWKTKGSVWYQKNDDDKEIVYGSEPDYSIMYGEGKQTDLSTQEKREKYWNSSKEKAAGVHRPTSWDKKRMEEGPEKN